MTELIGYIAAFLTTASFLPQAIQTIKTRDTSGISFWMYLMFVLGVSFWLAYGVLIENRAIVIANSVTLILAGLVLWVKIKNYSKQ
jgi:MtN3 and saliva related transmembrane protein